MLAYNGDEAAKNAVVLRLRAHEAGNEFLQGQRHHWHWNKTKGDAIGVTLRRGDINVLAGRIESEYETRFGIPQVLARFKNRIFEGLPAEDARGWARRFMAAIKPGADLILIDWKLLHWVLTEPKVNPGIEYPTLAKPIAMCADAVAKRGRAEIADGSFAKSAVEAANIQLTKSADRAAISALCAVSAATTVYSNWSMAQAVECLSWAAASARAAAREDARVSSAEVDIESEAGWFDTDVEEAGEKAACAAYALMADKVVELLEAAS